MSRVQFLESLLHDVYDALIGEDVTAYPEDIQLLLREIEDALNFEESEKDPFLTDAQADADVLVSAGMGTDEDYNHLGNFD
jgi:hypothetical protein